MTIATGYRASHLSKGADYDAAIAQGPFDRYMSDIERQVTLRLVDRLFPHGVPRYLDFACGTGRILSAVASRAHEACGVDVSETMLEQARTRCGHARLLLSDLTRDPADIGRFDLITAFRFFGNAEPPLRVAALRALSARLNPGGYLIVNNHRNRSSARNLLLSARGDEPWGDLSYLGLKKLLRAATLEPVRAYGVAFWFVRASLDRPEVFASRTVRLIEPVSQWPAVAPLCPDVIVVARKELTHA